MKRDIQDFGMKNYKVIFILFVVICFWDCNPKTNVVNKQKDNIETKQEIVNIIPDWKVKILKSDETKSLSLEEVKNFDFSKLWLDKRTDYLGYVGENYTRLEINFTGIEKISGTEYKVTGQTKVNGVTNDFNGKINITEAHEYVDKKDSYSEEFSALIKKEGCVFADFYFLTGNGNLKGLSHTNWYINTHDEFLYDDVAYEFRDGFSNNQFLGYCASDDSNQKKICTWGHYRIPYSRDLDIGAAEFSVNEKYIDNGWAGWLEDTENWVDPLGHLTDEQVDSLNITYYLQWYSDTIASGNYDRWVREFVIRKEDSPNTYKLIITKDSCIFIGKGPDMYFKDLCLISAVGEALSIRHRIRLDGKGNKNNPNLGYGEAAFLFTTDSNLYIKSERIPEMQRAILVEEDFSESLD